MKSAFEKMAAGFEDAIVCAGGDKTRGREAAPLDVKATRNVTRLIQDQFSATDVGEIVRVNDFQVKSVLAASRILELVRCVEAHRPYGSGCFHRAEQRRSGLSTVRRCVNGADRLAAISCSSGHASP